MADSIDRLTRALGRNAYIPWVFRLSLALEQVEWSEFCEDSATATFVLRSGFRAVKTDGGVTWFDTFLEAEAAGATIDRDSLGRPRGVTAPPKSLDPDAFARSDLISIVTDITRRMVQESGKHTSILGYLTGRHTLLRVLLGGACRDRIASSGAALLESADRDALQAAAQVSVRLAKIYGEAGVGGILIAEEDEVAGAVSIGPFEEVVNIAKYYNVPLVLLCRRAVGAEVRASIARTGVNHLVAPDVQGDLLTGIPEEIIGGRSESSSTQWARERHTGATGHRVFTSAWEVAADSPIEVLARMRSELVNEIPN